MTNGNLDTGLSSAILHTLFGAVFGAVLVAGIFFWFLKLDVVLWGSAISALVCALLAGIYRGRFWSAIADNPFFRVWRQLLGGR